jgi:hypothetical protein
MLLIDLLLKNAKLRLLFRIAKSTTVSLFFAIFNKEVSLRCEKPGCAVTFHAQAGRITVLRGPPMKSHPLPALTPLDQLLINVCDMDGTVAAGPPEWRFFLGYSPARELVVANAKGTVSKVRWMDVEGVAKRKAIIVRALTMQACSEREDARRMKEPYDPCWLPAAVLMAVLDPVTQRIDGSTFVSRTGKN